MKKGHFEAIKYAFRQGKDGYILSFVIHPDDIPAELVNAPIGTQWMIGFASVAEHDAELPTAEDVKGILKPAKPAKPKRRFEDMPLSQQAGLRCDEPDFWKFLVACGHAGIGNTENAANAVRFVCGVASRAALDNEGLIAAREKWRMLNQKYAGWIGTQRAIAQHEAHVVR